MFSLPREGSVGVQGHVVVARVLAEVLPFDRNLLLGEAVRDAATNSRVVDVRPALDLR